MGTEVRIALVAVGFTWNFQRTLQALLQRLIGPDQSLVELALVRREEPEFERQRLLTLLELEPRPAAVITLAYRPAPAAVEAFRAAGMPMILLDEAMDGASTVACDSFRGGYLAGQHLLGSGRRSLALVCGSSGAGGDFNAVERRRGFERALAEGGARLREEDVIEVRDYSRKDGLEAMETLARRGRSIDGIFCAAADATATGILFAARERRIKVPDQLAVVGFDDLPVAAISDPPLTTFRQPMKELAREALRLAVEERAAILSRPKTTLLEPTLVARSSA